MTVEPGNPAQKDSLLTDATGRYVFVPGALDSPEIVIASIIREPNRSAFMTNYRPELNKIASHIIASSLTDTAQDTTYSNEFWGVLEALKIEKETGTIALPARRMLRDGDIPTSLPVDNRIAELIALTVTGTYATDVADELMRMEAERDPTYRRFARLLVIMNVANIADELSHGASPHQQDNDPYSYIIYYSWDK